MVCASVRRDNPRTLARGLSLHTGAQIMLYLTCTMISSVNLACYGVSRAKDWACVDCGKSAVIMYENMCVSESICFISFMIVFYLVQVYTCA